MIDNEKSRRQMISAKKAAQLFGCSGSHLAYLGRQGELQRHIESDRVVFYYEDEVKRVAKEKAEARKKRGGRPRSAG